LPAGERGHLHQPVEKNGDLAEENSPSADSWPSR
jgi:hypothetical protein